MNNTGVVDNKGYKDKGNSLKMIENLTGFIVLLLSIYFAIRLGHPGLTLKLIVGMGFGYALTRGFMGFAGSVNRAYNTGSTKLIQVLMWLFLGTAVASTAFLYNPGSAIPAINPINPGLILGGLTFGFGMTFAMCCASGVLTDLVTGLPRAVIVLLFFGMGVFLGYPVQSTAPWITDSLFTTPTGAAMLEMTGGKFGGGVYLPDLFKWDGLNGYLGAIISTALLAGIVVYLSKRYEGKQKEAGTYTGVPSEKEQTRKYSKGESSVYEIFFVRPWTMRTGAIVIGGLFTLLMKTTKMGWGASTPYGVWFGKLLMVFGVSAERLAAYTLKPVEVFTKPFLSDFANVQNLGIVIGTLVCLLLAGTFTSTFKSELKITPKDVLLFAVGGLLMGFGTRLSNGCNVGALYTPIANFSLSGWIFFVALIAGGVFGNKMARFIK